MSARKRKLKLSEDWRDRIQAGVILDRLMKHLNNEIEMSPTQIKAAQIILGKIIPDLKSTDIHGEINQVVKILPDVRIFEAPGLPSAAEANGSSEIVRH